MEIYLPIAGVKIMAWKLVLLGLSVGVIGGFFGIGGAFMITPALNVFGFPMAYAIGTDMAHMAGKSIIATLKHKRLGNVDMRLGIVMILFTSAGIEAGARAIIWLERIGRIGPVVRIAYMLLLFGMGILMLHEYRTLTSGNPDLVDAGLSGAAKRLQNLHVPPMISLSRSGLTISLWVIALVAAGTGFLAGFLGVGGGFIRMPALIYIIGCPTTVAVGTDLFEVMVSGAYGAFTYAAKARVELFAALLMLCGAAAGAQFGALATKYVRGLTIRLYFALTMILSGISVLCKHLSSAHKAAYEPALNAWISASTGLQAGPAVREWVLFNKEAVRGWISVQSPGTRSAFAGEQFWNDCSGYIMLTAACGLSLVIICKMLQGMSAEKRFSGLEPGRDRVE